MADITIDSIKNFLKKIESTHAEEISSGVQALLRSLINCDANAIKTVSDNTFTFEKDAVKAGNSDLTDDALRKRVQFFNSFQETADTGLILKSRKHFYELNIDKQKFDLSASQNVVELSKGIAETYDEKPLVQPELDIGPSATVFISHKWHDLDNDAELNSIFKTFAYKLRDCLLNPPSGKPLVKLFCDIFEDNGLKSHSAFEPQQDRWCQASQVGLIFWSRKYYLSDNCKRELSFFIDSEGNDANNKGAIVLAEHGRFKQEMPDRLKKRIAFFYPKGNEVTLVKFWQTADLTDKDNYLAALCDCIYEALFEQKSRTDLIAPKLNTEKKPALDKLLLHAGRSQSIDTLEDEATQPPEAFGEVDEEHQRVKLIPVLKKWANDFGQKSTRVSVLLGDFGFGKTVSCRLLNKALSDDYHANPQEAMLPLYLDLKALQADIAEHKSKPIEHLLESMLQRTGEKLTVSGEEVVQYIRNNPCIVIFDGFDEIGHHLTEAEQQTVYDSLLDIIPSETYRQDAKRLTDKSDCAKHAKGFPSKLLISCRTHFFNRVSKEESFISGSNRHALGSNGAGLKNIHRFYMAPFSAGTVETYLCKVLGEKEGQDAKSMLSEIHDLSELSSHPIMLDLITRQLPQLQDQQLAGKTINSAVLYLNLFEAIGERDIGKHKIRLSDKQTLLAALAIHLWHKQQTSISYKRLDQWFAEYGDTNRTIKKQLLSDTNAMQTLMQDLCNASLLVRDKDRYRFAHTSYLEFFRAVGLFEAIRQHDDPNSFDDLTANIELKTDHTTLQFLLNWHSTTEPEDREEFDQQFLNLLESKSQLATRVLGFSIWRFAHLNITANTPRFPHSSNANWSGMHFNDEFIPNQLRSLDYSGLDLSHCSFQGVFFNSLKLSKTNFNGSHHIQVYFHNCELGSSTWKQANVSPDCFWPKLPKSIRTKTKTKAPNLLRYSGHFSPVNFANFSPDNNYIVSASRDNTLKMWRTDSGECIRTFKGHTSGVTCFAFSKNSKYFLSGSADNSLRAWDTASGDCIRIYKGHKETVNSIAFSLDRKQFISGSDDKTIMLWGIDSREHIRTFKGHTASITSIAFNLDGSLIVSGSADKTLKLWDTNSGKCLKTIQEAHPHSINNVSFNNNDVILSSDYGDINFRNWRSGEIIRTFKGHTSVINSTALSDDGKHIVSASGNLSLIGYGENDVKLWDAISGECISTLKGHTEQVTSANISNNNNYIVSTSEDCSFKLWDRHSGRCIRTFWGHISSINNVSIDSENNHIATASNDKTLRLWDLSSGDLMKVLSKNNSIINNTSFGHKNDFIASSSKSIGFFDTSENNIITLWDKSSGQRIRTLKGHSSEINSIAFSSDSSKIISASGDHSVVSKKDNTIRLWDTASGKLIRSFEGHTGTVYSARFSHNDRYIVSASGGDFWSKSDSTIKLWEASSGECLRTFRGHTDLVSSTAFSLNDDNIISASYDNTIKLWDSLSGKCIRTFKGHTGAALSICFSHDCDQIISASEDNTLRLWDTSSGNCLRIFEGHTRPVTSVIFNKNSNQIVSSSEDNTLKIWGTKTGKCLYTILQTPNGEIRYIDNENEILPQSIRGDAWRYCYTKDADGNTGHPCQYENWGEIYTP